MEVERDERPVGESCRLRFEDRRQYLYALLFGRYTPLDDAIQAWTAIADRCQDMKYKKVLIEEDVEIQNTLTEIYEFASQLPEMGFMGIQIAFVDQRPGQHLHNVFGENVAVNRGINGKVFRDVTKAERWLLGE